MSNRLPSECRTREDGGFTIIELMLTVVILIVGIVSVAQLVPVSVSSNLRNRNDTTALIAAQTHLEQIMQQPLGGAPGTCTAPGTADYYFCDATGSTILLGSSASAPNANTASGCALNSLGQIDFTSACDPGYSITEANPVTGTQVRLGIRVIQMHDAGGNPFRKVFIIGAQSGTGAFSNTTPTLTGVVGR